MKRIKWRVANDEKLTNQSSSCEVLLLPLFPSLIIGQQTIIIALLQHLPHVIGRPSRPMNQKQTINQSKKVLHVILWFEVSTEGVVTQDNPPPFFLQIHWASTCCHPTCLEGGVHIIALKPRREGEGVGGGFFDGGPGVVGSWEIQLIPIHELLLDPREQLINKEKWMNQIMFIRLPIAAFSHHTARPCMGIGCGQQDRQGSRWWHRKRVGCQVGATPLRGRTGSSSFPHQQDPQESIYGGKMMKWYYYSLLKLF